MLTRSRAIVLHIIRFSDDKMICRVYTETAGIVSLLVRRGSSKMSHHRLFTPLALLQIEWDKTTADRPVYPKNVAAIAPYASIPYDPLKTSVALFLCEFLNAALRSEPASPALFAFVEQSLMLYDRLSDRHANFHLVFLLQLATFLGVQPNVSGYTEGAYFDLRDGCFTATCPPHHNHIPPAEAAALPVLMRMSFANMHLYRLSGTQRSLLLAHLVTYYRLHIPAFPELKSLAVLREVWA